MRPNHRLYLEEPTTLTSPTKTVPAPELTILVKPKTARGAAVSIGKWGSDKDMEFIIKADRLGVYPKGGPSFELDIFGIVKKHRVVGYEFVIREMTKKATYRFVRRVCLD